MTKNEFQRRSAELDYFLTLLPLSSLNTDDISWTVYESYPGYVALRKKVSSYIDDEFTITPTLYGDGSGVWEISGARIVHGRNSGEDYRSAAALPLRANSHIIATLDTLLNKAVIACAPKPQVVALGTMNYDPVEGEPDYVKPKTTPASLTDDEYRCDGCQPLPRTSCGEPCAECTCGYIPV